MGLTGPQGRKGEKVTADLFNERVVELVRCLSQFKKCWFYLG